jgi:hypothetical protein
VCEYNSVTQPVGMSAMKFRWMTGSIVKNRNYVRMWDDWSDVPKCTKEDI